MTAEVVVGSTITKEEAFEAFMEATFTTPVAVLAAGLISAAFEA